MKSQNMENFLNNFTKQNFGRDRNAHTCVTCGSCKIKPEDFKDDLSRREFDISKMCQECQDGVFG